MGQVTKGRATGRKKDTMKAKTDEARGRNDRLAGFYDKWYRYNRADEGAEYDKGCAAAVNSGKCKDTFTLIECDGASRN